MFDGIELLLIIGGIAIFIVGVKVAPYIRYFWHEKAVPVIEKIKNKLIGKSPSSQERIYFGNEQVELASALHAEIAITEFSEEIDNALSEYEADMSSEEAQEHLINIIMLAVCLAEEIRKFSGAINTNSKDYLELQQTMEKLTTQKVTDSINMILANNISMIDACASKTFSEFLGGSSNQNEAFIPIENTKVKEVLSVEKTYIMLKSSNKYIIVDSS